jgi:hypothetical protein
VSAATAEHIFLAGWPPLPEFLGFVASQSVDHSQSDLAPLTEAWIAANDRVRRLEASEAGIADGVTIGSVPSALAGLAAEVEASDLAQRQYGNVPFRVGMIELDRTIVFQRQINVDHARAIRASFGGAPSDEDVFRLCLPLGETRVDADVRGGLAEQHQGGSRFILAASSTDLRVFAPQLVDAADVTAHIPGVAAKYVVVPVGFSANFVSALAFNGRVLLNNGSHRAFALREAGVTHVPALVQEVSRPDLLPILTSDKVIARVDDFFVAPRPPLLKDYFDDALGVIVRVERKARQITVVTQTGELDVPA